MSGHAFMNIFPDEEEYIERTIRGLPTLRKKGKLTEDEAAAVIADDDELFEVVALYTAQDPQIFEREPQLRDELLKILRRVKPFTPSFKTFYRGQPGPCGPEPEEMARGFRSWSVNRETAEDFARDYPHDVRIVCTRIGPVRGVSISDIVMWRMRVRDESHYSGMQAEWLLLEEEDAQYGLGGQRGHPWAYHATGKRNLASIELDGLVPAPQPACHADEERCTEEPVIFYAPTANIASTWGEIVLRFPEPLEHHDDWYGDGMIVHGRYTRSSRFTHDPVRPDEIDVQVGKSWIPITDPKWRKLIRKTRGRP